MMTIGLSFFFYNKELKAPSYTRTRTHQQSVHILTYSCKKINKNKLLTANTRCFKHCPLHSSSIATFITAADVHAYVEMWWQPPSITVYVCLVAPYGACQPGDGVTSVSSATFWLSAAYPVTSALSLAHSKPAQSAQLKTWNYTPTLWLAAEVSTDWLMKALQLYPLCYWLKNARQ